MALLKAGNWCYDPTSNGKKIAPLATIVGAHLVWNHTVPKPSKHRRQISWHISASAWYISWLPARMVADEFLAKDNGASTYQTFLKKAKTCKNLGLVDIVMSYTWWGNDPQTKTKTQLYMIYILSMFTFWQGFHIHVEKLNDSAGKSGEEQGS